MALHAASWPSLDQEPMTSPGDAGVTEPQDQPRHASSLSLDQQAADILKLFGQDTTDCNDENSMDLDAFTFESPSASMFGAMDDGSHAGPMSTVPTSALPTSNCGNNGAQPAFGLWPATSDPPYGYEQTAFHPGPWTPGPRYEQPHTLGFNSGQGLGIHMPPASSPVNRPMVGYNTVFAQQGSPVDLHPEFGARSHGNGWNQTPMQPAEDIFAEDGDEDSPDSADPCYAQLLYKCLKEAPGHMLSLRELYEWVSRHSAKAKDPTNRGWQNSVRHNLSMNAAFRRVNGAHTGKKGSLWQLTEEALRDGVISTTRYRKDPKRKPERRGNPAINRQLSGAKGGRATRDASRLRQQQQRMQHGFSSSSSSSSSRHFRHSDRRHVENSPQYSPYSVRSVPHSPQPFMPHLQYTLPNSAPTSQPASPYFNVAADMSQHHQGLFTSHGLPLASYAPATDGGEEEEGAVESRLPLEKVSTSSSAAPNFELLPLDLSQGWGLFGDHDPELLGNASSNTPTPSLMTEASFMED